MRPYSKPELLHLLTKKIRVGLLPAQHIVIAETYRHKATRSKKLCEFWHSRARVHELWATHKMSLPRPPIGYDKQKYWREKYFAWWVNVGTTAPKEKLRNVNE